MHKHQRRFLDLALHCQALRFGDFTLKSGRQSPYFFNAGCFDHGAAMASLGACYAEALIAAELGFDMLFGPAYKGIPLATAVAIAMAHKGRDLPLAFNRKEAKGHGEGGSLIGARLRGRVLIVDDVITAGTAVRESITLIRSAGAEVCGVLVALDRQERGESGLSATEEITRTHGLPVVSIAKLADLLTYTADDPALVAQQSRLLAYRAQYGVP
ncbi:MAG TPA: orotate phosphoribosyltransferase [Chiayiivirga sp.]|nr:orotate phosphoribosyltransferase [Chiayiivirga sp.]